MNTSSFNFTIKDVISLVSPVNASIETSRTVDFTCYANSTSGISNISLWTNSSGNWQSIYTNTTPSGNSAIGRISFTFGADRGIVWACEMCNVNNECIFSEENRSFQIYSSAFHISNLSITPLRNNYLLNVNLSANVTIGDNQINVSHCNFTLIDPNGYYVLNMSNGSLLGNSSLLTNVLLNTTGTYNLEVNCTSYRKIQATRIFIFNVTHELFTPNDFSFSAQSENNETQYFNLSFYDNTNASLTYNISVYTDNDANFTKLLNVSTFVLDNNDKATTPYTIEFVINGSSEVNTTHTGNITITNTTYNINKVIYFTYYINPPAGEPTIYYEDSLTYCDSLSSGTCAKISEIRVDDSTSVTYIINNTKYYDLIDCVPIIGNNSFGFNQFNLTNWFYFNIKNFNLTQNNTQAIVITFTPTSPADITTDYVGNFYIKCNNGDLAGNQVETLINNRPYIRLDIDGKLSLITSTPGGGGGGIPALPKVIVGETNETRWTMETREGAGSYQINYLPGTSKSKDILFQNFGTSSRQISMSCENVEGDLCKYVTFDRDEFNLPLVLDIKEINTFTIDAPSDIDEKVYIFNVIATDDLNKTGRVTTTVNAELKNKPLQYLIVKLTSSKNIGGINFPNSLIFIFIFILSSILFYYLLFRKSKINIILSGILGLIIALVTLFIL